MINSHPIVAPESFRCICRISDPLVRQWVMSSLNQVTENVEYESTNPQLIVYDRHYRRNILQDLAKALLDNATILLCLDEECKDSYLNLFRLNVRHIVYPESPFSVEALQLAARSSGKVQGVHFPSASEIEMQQMFSIQTARDYDAIPKKVHQVLYDMGFGIMTHNATLALREGLTNAVFHSFREAGCHARKYSPESFLGLYDDDTVDVSLTATRKWIRITIVDNSGSLGPLSVANSMDRHRADLGVHDFRGRGFYLMQQLSHRMVVTIRRGRNTTVELYFLKAAPNDFLRHFELVEI